MKANQMRDMTVEELEQQLRETRRELFNLRMQRTTGQLENPARLRTVRRDLARTVTFLNQRKKATT